MLLPRRFTVIAVVLLLLLIAVIILNDLSTPTLLNATTTSHTLAPGTILTRPTANFPNVPPGGNLCLATIVAGLTATTQNCQVVGRNQVCYGNASLEAEPQEGVADFVFEETGDVENIARMRSLTSSPLYLDGGSWGVALLYLQAGIPDTLPGQNVAMLVFGDVAIENAIVGASSLHDPMQAFYLKTGIGDAPCDGAPDSGVLLQGPAGSGMANMIANEVEIGFDGTLYLQAWRGREILVHVLTGQASVTAQGVSVRAPAGEVVEVPLSENLTPNGRPQSFRFNPNQPTLQALPLQALPSFNTIATPTS